MATDLYKVSSKHWVVKLNDTELESFNSVDKACDFLETNGIPGDEVDAAIMYMAANHHTHARFGSVNGLLIMTDAGKIDVGTA